MKRRGIKAVLAAMVVTSIMAGCGNSSETAKSEDYGDYAVSNKAMATAEYATEMAYDEEEYYADVCASEMYADEYEADSLGALGNASNANVDSSASKLEYEDKLVYEANLTIETLDFDKTYSDLVRLIEENGGRIESESYDAHFESYTQNKKNMRGYYTAKQDYLVIRIPSKNYNSFISSDAELGNVTGKTQNLTNITQEYYSTTTKIELLEGQLEYYKYQLKLIEEKLMDCEDYEYVIGQMVELEDRIIDVQDQINQCTNSVKTMDMQVTYSTIYLTLSEVKEYSDNSNITEEPEDTFINRLLENLSESGRGFLRFLEGLLTFLIYAVPYVVVIGLIIFGIVKLIKLVIIGKKNKKKEVAKKEVAKKEVAKKEVLPKETIEKVAEQKQVEDNSEDNK